jgi:hypothetical protein
MPRIPDTRKGAQHLPVYLTGPVNRQLQKLVGRYGVDYNQAIAFAIIETATRSDVALDTETRLSWDAAVALRKIEGISPSPKQLPRLKPDKTVTLKMRTNIYYRIVAIAEARGRSFAEIVNQELLASPNLFPR